MSVLGICIIYKEKLLANTAVGKEGWGRHRTSDCFEIQCTVTDSD